MLLWMRPWQRQLLGCLPEVQQQRLREDRQGPRQEIMSKILFLIDDDLPTCIVLLPACSWWWMWGGVPETFLSLLEYFWSLQIFITRSRRVGVWLYWPVPRLVRVLQGIFPAFIRPFLDHGGVSRKPLCLGWLAVNLVTGSNNAAHIIVLNYKRENGTN